MLVWRENMCVCMMLQHFFKFIDRFCNNILSLSNQNPDTHSTVIFTLNNVRRYTIYLNAVKFLHEEYLLQSIEKGHVQSNPSTHWIRSFRSMWIWLNNTHDKNRNSSILLHWFLSTVFFQLCIVKMLWLKDHTREIISARSKAGGYDEILWELWWKMTTLNRVPNHMTRTHCIYRTAWRVHFPATLFIAIIILNICYYINGKTWGNVLWVFNISSRRKCIRYITYQIQHRVNDAAAILFLFEETNTGHAGK